MACHGLAFSQTRQSKQHASSQRIGLFFTVESKRAFTTLRYHVKNLESLQAFQVSSGSMLLASPFAFLLLERTASSYNLSLIGPKFPVVLRTGRAVLYVAAAPSLQKSTTRVGGSESRSPATDMVMEKGELRGVHRVDVKARPGRYLGWVLSPAWQVRQGYLLRYQFEIGRTFPRSLRNCS